MWVSTFHSQKKDTYWRWQREKTKRSVQKKGVHKIKDWRIIYDEMIHNL